MPRNQNDELERLRTRSLPPEARHLADAVRDLDTATVEVAHWRDAVATAAASNA